MKFVSLKQVGDQWAVMHTGSRKECIAFLVRLVQQLDPRKTRAEQTLVHQECIEVSRWDPNVYVMEAEKTFCVAEVTDVLKEDMGGGRGFRTVWEVCLSCRTVEILGLDSIFDIVRKGVPA